jgi:hypothetical protein
MSTLWFGASRPVGRADDRGGSAVQYVRVDHRRPHVRVAQQLPDRSDVVAVFEQVCRERVTKTVGIYRSKKLRSSVMSWETLATESAGSLRGNQNVTRSFQQAQVGRKERLR